MPFLWLGLRVCFPCLSELRSARGIFKLRVCFSLAILGTNETTNNLFFLSACAPLQYVTDTRLKSNKYCDVNTYCFFAKCRRIANSEKINYYRSHLTVLNDIGKICGVGKICDVDEIVEGVERLERVKSNKKVNIMVLFTDIVGVIIEILQDMDILYIICSFFV